jgi:hypothetical protein
MGQLETLKMETHRRLEKLDIKVRGIYKGGGQPNDQLKDYRHKSHMTGETHKSVELRQPYEEKATHGRQDSWTH